MKNKTLLFSAALLLTLMSAAGTAFAEKGGKNSQETTSEQTTIEATNDTEVAADGEVKAEGEAEADEEAAEGEKSGKKEKDGSGLQNAYEKTKDKPAGERIAELLKTKYGIDVTVSADANLAEVVTDLEAQGELEAAEDVQAELVAEDPTNVELYVKLGKLKEKNGEKGVKAYVNGEEPVLDTPPVVKEGRVLVPFRAIAESLDAEVKWDAATKTVTVTRDGVEVKLVLGSKEAYINGAKKKLDVPGQAMKNRVFVPMRFLSEAFDATCIWESKTSSVIVVDETTVAAAADTTVESEASAS